MELYSNKKIFSHFILLWCFLNIVFTPSVNADVSSNIDVSKYTLSYSIDLENDNFTGTVNIAFHLKEAEKLGTSITLESKGLGVTQASISDPTGVVSLAITVNPSNVTLKLPKQLQSQSAYNLFLTFTGALQKDGTGIFKYMANNSPYISTNFYPVHAAKAFPCFNDVSIKAKFLLSINVEKQSGLKAFSNTPQSNNNDVDSKFYFEETPRMAVYSLFFTIGHYERSQIIPTLYVPMNKVNFNEELLYVLSNRVYKDLVNATTSSGTPLIKLIAVPGLPRSTVIGHGIVAIREDNVFQNFKQLTTKQRKATLLEIFGAIFKLFFGNYITPKSWSDAWLIESVAIYLQYNGFSQIEQWDYPNDYINYDIIDDALHLNELPGSLPIVNKALKTEEDIINLINSPAMLKGAGLLHMVENVLSKDILPQVLVDYFTHRTQEAGNMMDTDDFVDYISRHKSVVAILKNINLKDVLANWLNQAGYPYIQSNRAGSGITAEEKLFIGGLSQVKGIKPWKLPVWYTTQQLPSFQNNDYTWILWDDNRTISLNMTAKSTEWVLLNFNGNGLYRVNYVDSDWMNLAIALNEDHNLFPISTRTKLISDLFAMMFSGRVDIETAFNVLSYLPNEEALTPWLTALKGLKYLRNLLYQTDLKESCSNYTRVLLKPLYTKLGVDSPHTKEAENILRQSVVSTMCNVGGQDCLRTTKEDYNKMQNTSSGYQPQNDMIPIIQCTGIRDITERQEWEKIFNEIFANQLIMGKEIKKAYFEVMACPINEPNILLFLDKVFSKKSSTNFYREDIRNAFKAVYTNPAHTNYALNYFTVNAKEFKETITLKDQIQLIYDIAPYLTTDKDMDVLKEYIKVVQPPAEIVNAVQLAMSTLTQTKTFITKNHDKFRLAFQPLPTPTHPTPTTVTTSSGSTSSDVTPTSTGKPDNSSTTTKPHSSASLFSAFNFLTLLLIFSGLHLIT